MRLLLAAAILAVGGCSITGTDSKSRFACEAPEGVQCMATSGVYYNSLSNNLPALRPARSGSGASEEPGRTVSGGTATQEVAALPDAQVLATVRAAVGRRGPAFDAAGAVRAAPRTIRIWVLPWEDADGDLHDQAYLYLTLDSGRWLVEHTRNSVQPRRPGGTTLLQGDVALGADARAEIGGGKSTFSRQMEQLAPAKPDSAN